MPRSGGEAGKLGDAFEAVWTVDAAIDVFVGAFHSITVEAFGDESLGVEFHLQNHDGSLQFHSVKRQKQGGDWSVADLCRKDKTTGRCILGDLFDKRTMYSDAETRFISSTGANDLRELSERAETPTCVSDFRKALSSKLLSEFNLRLIPLCNQDADSAVDALKALEVILRTHRDLVRTVDRRIDGLFYRIDGSALRPDDVRRMIAGFILQNLGPSIDAERLGTLFLENGIGVRDWKTDTTVNNAVVAINGRFVTDTETELINSAQIDRDIVRQMVEELSRSVSSGTLLVGPGGYGKSCVLAQCLHRLRKTGIPFLCLRMDSFELCNTTRQLGKQIDLPSSPAVVLAGVADNSPSVLIVDQLDAMSLVSGRNPRMWEVFRELCNEVSAYPNMKVILACRDFDLNHDQRLRTLGDSRSGFTKFELGRLSDADIRQSLENAGHGTLTPNEKQIDILGVPFHLLLFLQGDPTRAFSTVGELYDRYWNRKRHNLKQYLGRDSNWNQVIDALTQRMSKQQVLFAPKAVVDNWDADARAMTSEHVLVEVQNQRQYRFFHESFFDYAYARRFCATGSGVVELLTSSEQHLFRRAQVRQILAYRRENDFDQYITDVSNIFDSPDVRFHIKCMVASEFNRIDEPVSEEWYLAEPYLLNGDLSRFVSSALRDHVGWFDLLDSLHVYESWLATDDAGLNNTAIWYMESRGLHDHRSSRIAELIAPYAKRDDNDWRKRILRIMSWEKSHKSKEMATIYLDLIKRGAYDDYESDVSGSDFWSQHYDAQKESPRFVVDVVATWLDHTVEKFDDGESIKFFDNCKLNQSHSGALMVGKVASDEPEYFVEQMLPRVTATIVKTGSVGGSDTRNRAWPLLSNYGEVFDINDAVLLSLRKSLQDLAQNKVEVFRQYAATITPYAHQTFGYLLLRAWADNPKEFADEAARYFIEDQRRFNIGYDIMSGGGDGIGESAISRMALRAISPRCSEELFEQLEFQIIGYCGEYERQSPKWRGFSELLVLRSLDLSRISRNTALRIEELERKFPNATDVIIEEDASIEMKGVASPIPQRAAEIMTDDQWLSAMKKYDRIGDRFRGGPVELSRSLAEFARKDRNRFAALAAKMADDTAPRYFSAILDGLCSRFVNLNAEEKEADQQAIKSTSTDTFLRVIKRLHELPDRPCGTAIAGCIRILSDRHLPSNVLDIVSYYAIYDPDPEADQYKQNDERERFPSDPHSHGINTVRGQAAEAISALLYDDQTRLDALRPALHALTQDPVIAVRTCAIDAILPLLNFSQDLAVELFLVACNASEAICATQPFEQFVYYATYTHYTSLRELLQLALHSENAKAVENAARQIVLAELSGVDVGSDASDIRSGSESMREAAADIYSRSAHLASDAIGDQCVERLGEFLNDDAKSVRQEVSSAFFNMPGEQLLHLKEFIARFIDSRSFEHGPNRLLRALEESNVELPQIICRAAERVLEFLGEEGTHIAYHGSMIATSISTLVVRQYEQTTDGEIKRQCLDLIDRMEQVGYLGINDELRKIDR